ncbi:glycosyltransferase family 2 protein [Aestuariibius sp. 2305UL40-4]|uniref:glycosyltransferase family 2 protein n=1 Tax=Aestuariibius violaceus TaxID=3234132 RepID=UPI00345F0772
MSDGTPRSVLVACMKDEGPFVLEWIAYHKSIGFNDFIILTNDCTDGTDLILDRLDDMGIVQHLPNPWVIGAGEKTLQSTAIEYAQLQKRFRLADWVFIADADEFLNIQIGNKDLPSLFGVIGDAQAISFNQVVFGNAGIQEFVDAPVTMQFFRRFDFSGDSPRLYPMMFGLKTLAHNRGDIYSRFTNHIPRLKKPIDPGLIWMDGGGKPVDPRFLNSQTRSYPVYMHRSKDPKTGKVQKTRKLYDAGGPTHDLGYVNHYALKSLESFVVQSRRGDAVNPEIRRDVSYWRSYDRNDVEDRTIVPQAERSRDLLEDFKKDPVLGPLHDIAVKRHREIYRKMLKQNKVRNLIEECLAAASGG